MAGRRRPPTKTPRSSRRSPQAPSLLEQAQQLLLAQTEAFAALQRQVATLPSRRLSASEKCHVGPSTAAFRSWRRSMKSWLGLSHFPPAEAVQHIRLHCTPALQRSLGSRFTADQWEALSAQEALDAIGRIALQATNQAADWCKFFSAAQEPSESICEYFTRST